MRGPAATPALLADNAPLPGSRQIGTTLRGLRNGAAQALAGPAVLLFGEVLRKRAYGLIGRDLLADVAPLRRVPR